MNPTYSQPPPEISHFKCVQLFAGSKECSIATKSPKVYLCQCNVNANDEFISHTQKVISGVPHNITQVFEVRTVSIFDVKRFLPHFLCWLCLEAYFTMPSELRNHGRKCIFNTTLFVFFFYFQNWNKLSKEHVFCNLHGLRHWNVTTSLPNWRVFGRKK